MSTPHPSSNQCCESKKRVDGSQCDKPARYRLLAIPDGKDKERLVCSKHARHYSKAWLEKLS